MALAWTRGRLNVGTTNVTSYIRSLSLDYAAEMLDRTVMGDLTRKSLPGLKVWSVTAELKQDTAGALDALLFPLIGSTGFTVYCQSLATSNVSDANPRYSGTAVLENYNPLGGSVGDLRVSSVTFRSAGTLSRSTAT